MPTSPNVGNRTIKSVMGSTQVSDSIISNLIFVFIDAEEAILNE